MAIQPKDYSYFLRKLPWHGLNLPLVCLIVERWSHLGSFWNPGIFIYSFYIYVFFDSRDKESQRKRDRNWSDQNSDSLSFSLGVLKACFGSDCRLDLFCSVSVWSQGRRHLHSTLISFWLTCKWKSCCPICRGEGPGHLGDLQPHINTAMPFLSLLCYFTLSNPLQVNCSDVFVGFECYYWIYPFKMLQLINQMSCFVLSFEWHYFMEGFTFYVEKFNQMRYQYNASFDSEAKNVLL